MGKQVVQKSYDEIILMINFYFEELQFKYMP